MQRSKLRRRCRTKVRSSVSSSPAIITFACAFVLYLMMGVTAHAFKPRTHVWVAQEVLNDVIPDGRVTIGGKEYRVSDHIVASLRAHPDVYRMGHIGPDAYPDVLVGQTALHPGIPDGWQADDWMSWLRGKAGTDQVNTAFAYGMLGHAAGDIMAHSYVNLYAGDVFLLTDGEADVELRHYGLETYIERFTPPLRDHTGADLGQAANLVRAPHQFLAEQLIFTRDAATQYVRQPGRPGSHLLAMRELHIQLGRAANTSRDVTNALVKGRIALENAAIDLARKTNDLVGPIAAAQRQLAIAQGVLDLEDKAIQTQIDIINAQEKIITDAEATITEAGQKLSSLPTSAADVQNVITDAQRRLVLVPAKVAENVCGMFKGWKKIAFGLVIPILFWGCTVNEVANPAYVTIVNEIANLQGRYQSLRGEIQSWTVRQTAAIAAKQAAFPLLAAAKAERANLEARRMVNKTGREAAAKAKEALAALKRTEKKLLDEAEALKAKIDKFRGLELTHGRVVTLALEHWQKDVHKAVVEYQATSTKVMQAFLRGADPLKPLSDWKECWGPVFMAVPKEPLQVGCAVKHGLEELNQLKESVRKDLRDAAGPAGWLIDPAGKLEEVLRDELTKTVAEASAKVISVIDENVATLIRMQTFGVDDNRLNQLFAADESKKGLLLINDVAARVNVDMQRGNGATFSAGFAPAYNAVVLAKLSLLDGQELNRLSRDMGLKGKTKYGDELYPVGANTNVLLGVARSLDGNHQWQELAPKYPRRSGVGDPDWPSQRKFGYDGGSPKGGMRLWADKKARKAVFARLFRAPLAPAMESPAQYGFTDLLDAQYPRASADDPFPETKMGLFHRALEVLGR